MLNIIVPIAGKSHFFDAKKDGFPKPFIEICGKTMLELFIENYENITDKRLIFILKDDENRQFFLSDAIHSLTKNSCEIITIKNQTSGMVCSTMLAVDFIDNDEPLLIVNMDQIFECDLNAILKTLYDYDAGVLTFSSVHPRWAYVKCDAQNFVMESFEKQPKSKNAIAGFYFFKTGHTFMEAAKNIIRKDVNYEGQYFIASVLNELVLKNKKILNIPIPKELYHTFFSPAKIKEYENAKNENF